MIRVRAIVAAPIRFYRTFLSPLKKPCCRFTPTCSRYALDALEKRGVFFGLLLTVWRVLRCNPFCRGGYDPVPEKGEYKKRERKSKKEMSDTPHTPMRRRYASALPVAPVAPTAAAPQNHAQPDREECV